MMKNKGLLVLLVANTLVLGACSSNSSQKEEVNSQVSSSVVEESSVTPIVIKKEENAELIQLANGLESLTAEKFQTKMEEAGYILHGFSSKSFGGILADTDFLLYLANKGNSPKNIIFCDAKNIENAQLTMEYYIEKFEDDYEEEYVSSDGSLEIISKLDDKNKYTMVIRKDSVVLNLTTEGLDKNQSASEVESLVELLAE